MERSVPTLPDKPSIAVLPFTNLSSNPGEEYLADGIVEDMITELSRFSELFVIARNSSFQYKGKAVDVRQVGRELGLHYVLEGSIRRGGNRIRIAAQLIDAATGAHRWAERYDRKLQDTFVVQDEVVRTIVAILAAHVRTELTRSACDARSCPHVDATVQRLHNRDRESHRAQPKLCGLALWPRSGPCGQSAAGD